MSKHIALPRLTQLAASIAVAVGGLAFVPAANAAAPLAGTNISNIATASYTDANNTPRSVTSNEVKTTVLQVASFTLEANQSTTANPNGQVSLSHTLTNTGNGADTFTVNLANVTNGTNGDTYDFSNIRIYLDADKNGVPDNNVDIKGQTISVAAGQSVGLIVVATTPTNAAEADVGKLTVSATTSVIGTPPNEQTKTNTDTVKIVTDAVIQVTKSANVTSVNPAAIDATQRTIEYTLSYKNTGNTAATNVTLQDILPANVTYVPGSGVWSGSATARTDAAGDETNGKYDFDTATRTLNFVIASVAPNTTGTLKFKVVVNANTPAGTVVNQATFDPDGPGTKSPEKTNESIVIVNSIYAGTINDSATDKYADIDKVAGTPAKDDTITATTAQGVAVNFGNNGGEEIWIHNTGNVAETYNISLLSSTLPAGSTVQLFKADGLTPLTDTNGDPIVDTGSIAVLGSQRIVARVTLPSTYKDPVPVSAVLSIQPVSDNTALADTITLTITSITAARVDLSNGKGDLDGVQDDTPNAGEGPYVAADIIDTRSVNPGASVTFPLAVTNFGSNSDNFNISSDLPAGWTVKYYTSNAAGVCTTNQVTNTGNIVANGTAYLCATVTAPVGAAPGNTDVVFTVRSAATNLEDSMKDRVTVNAVRNVSFTPDRTGQVAPGGSVTYTHILTNNGNVTEGVAGGNLLPFTVTNVGNLGATTSVYVDLDNNGIADPNELVTGTDLTALLGGVQGAPGNAAIAGLQPGESVTILVKVEAPTNANAGQADTSTVTITPTGSTAVSINDTTTVNIGQVRLTKQQALDVGCDGTPDGAYSLNTIQAKPGTCVAYQITAANDGNQPVTGVVINDTVPTYTTLQTPPVPALTPAAKGTVTVVGSALASTSFGLLPAESVNLNFTVKINE